MTGKNIESKLFLVDLQKKFRNMFVIENKLSLLYRRGKSMRYPESPKVTKGSFTLLIKFVKSTDIFILLDRT